LPTGRQEFIHTLEDPSPKFQIPSSKFCPLELGTWSFDIKKNVQFYPVFIIELCKPT